MFKQILSKILGGSVEVVADYFAKRDELKSRERIRKMELEDAIQSRRVELIKQGLAADATWELEQIRNSGWKDEYVLAVISIPTIMCFTDAGAERVRAGFEALSATPVWYQGIVVTIFLAVFGVRYWRRQQYDTE